MMESHKMQQHAEQFGPECLTQFQNYDTLTETAGIAMM